MTKMTNCWDQATTHRCPAPHLPAPTVQPPRPVSPSSLVGSKAESHCTWCWRSSHWCQVLRPRWSHRRCSLQHITRISERKRHDSKLCFFAKTSPKASKNVAPVELQRFEICWKGVVRFKEQSVVKHRTFTTTDSCKQWFYVGPWVGLYLCCKKIMPWNYL